MRAFSVTSSFVILSISTTVWAAEAKSVQQALVGTWKATISSEEAGQTFTPTLKFALVDGKLSGKYISSLDGAETAIKELRIKDSGVKFTVERELQGSTFIGKFALTLEGETLVGDTEYSYGDQAGKAQFKATKAKPPNLAPYVGQWTIEIKTNAGQSYTAGLELKKEGESLAGVYTAALDQSKTALSGLEVEGKDISFKVERERDGATIKLTYSGSLEGDAIKGTMTFKSPDREGEGEFVARRSK